MKSGSPGDYGRWASSIAVEGGPWYTFTAKRKSQGMTPSNPELVTKGQGG